MSDLDPMHRALAARLMKKLESDEITAAELNVIRQFLKDNGVEAKAPPGSPIANLAARLPFAGQFQDEDDDTPARLS